jgi:hypothetical protein
MCGPLETVTSVDRELRRPSIRGSSCIALRPASADLSTGLQHDARHATCVSDWTLATKPKHGTCSVPALLLHSSLDRGW